ncbi:MAG: sugar-transfer associated ATP-grasp domain-containing protein [Christensenellales bacterium]
MGRLSFFFKRLGRMDYRKMWATLQILQERSGKGRAWLLGDLLRCALKFNAGYMDYMIAEMYRLNDRQKATVITRGINNALVRRLNQKDYWHAFDDKAEFNTRFAKWVARDWLRADESLDNARLKNFLAGKEAVFVKPIAGSSGVGVSKYLKADWQDLDAFHARVEALGISIVEDCVIQHPLMASLCPSSVNTVRISTILGDKREGIVYAFLRIGNGKVMDNVDCGGMAARVDLDSGRLLTVAADKQGRTFTHHPITGTAIIGFQLPFFAEAKALCLEAMHVVPQLRYVAWDVALTADGPRLIEGNSFPSHAVPQFAAHYPQGIGILPEFRQFLDV